MDFLYIGSIILILSTIINVFFIVFIVFYERKSPVTVIAWVFALTFIPVLGFIFYLFFGGTKRLRMKKKFKNKRGVDDTCKSKLYEHLQIEYSHTNIFDDKSAKKYQDLITMLLNTSDSAYTQHNNIKIYTLAQDKYEALLEDILAAKKNINMSYFIFRNDQIGNRIVAALTQKAKEGVMVKLMYDDLGSAFTSDRMFDSLRQSGGEVLKFLPTKLGLIGINANYRYHRKMVIIDGEISYLGGMNIGDEYTGLHKRIKPWRDTHLRITGEGVFSLQTRFMIDWIYSLEKDNDIFKDEYLKDFFPALQPTGNIGMQTVSSGPDTSEEEIKVGLIKMITSAKKKIHIQTPYFVPDESFLEALKIAAMCGVEVNVMIPGVADKAVVFHASNSYIKDLLDYGMNVFKYNGFIHSKVVVVDGEIASTGTTNIDIRSFSLNFEINAFIYSEEFAKECIQIFLQDVKNSTKITAAIYYARSWHVKMKEAICRLFSPVL